MFCRSVGFCFGCPSLGPGGEGLAVTRLAPLLPSEHRRGLRGGRRGGEGAVMEGGNACCYCSLSGL